MRKSLGANAVSSFLRECLSNDIERGVALRMALRKASEQEHALTEAVGEVSRVLQEQQRSIGEMRAAAEHLRESAAALVRGVDVNEAEERVSQRRIAWGLHPHDHWGTGWY